MFAERTASGTPRARATRRQWALQRRDCLCRRWSMCSARSARAGRGNWLRPASNAVESAPPLKATHSAMSCQSGSSCASCRCSHCGPKLDGPPRGARAMCALRSVLGKYAEAGDFLGALGAQLIAWHRVELIEMADERRLEAGGHRGGVAVRTAERLFDDLIHQAELLQPVGGQVEGLGGRFLLVLTFPQDRGAAL